MKVKKIKRKTFKIRPSGRSTDYISPSFGYGCLYDCSYCYMKRHKPGGLSVATNTEDILTEINSHAAFADAQKPNQTHVMKILRYTLNIMNGKKYLHSLKIIQTLWEALLQNM